MRKAENAESAVQISQDMVDQLQKAHTMEDYIRIAAENGIDWNTLDDEWLDAIVAGDVSDLLWRQQRRLRKAGKEKHEDGI